MKKSIFLVAILLCQGQIENFIPQLNILDELIVIIFIILAIYKIIICKKALRLYQIEKFMIFSLCLYISIGLISNYKSEILINNIDILRSLFLSLKAFIVYFFCRIYFQNINLNTRYLEKIYYFLIKVIYFYVGIIIINYFFNFLKPWDNRFGFIKIVSVGFSHPAEFDFFIVSISSLILFLSCILEKNINYFKKLIIPLTFLILSSGRIKALVYFLIFVIAYFIILKNRRMKFIYIIPIIPIVAYIAHDRFISQIINSKSARGNLYKTSLEIGKDFFPLGSGFGTFGTEMSRVKYSSLYYIYGISGIYGLRPDYPAFITDTYWPAVIGEVGFLGLILMIGITFGLIKLCISITRNNMLKLGVVSLLGYGIFASVADSIFTTYRGVAIMIITSFMISFISKINRKV